MPRECKTVYYTDELNDDFAGTKIVKTTIGEDYVFAPKSRLWDIAAAALYYVVACPIVFIVSKLWMGLKIVDRSNIKKLKGRGFFLYGNHTQYLDAFTPGLVSLPHKAYIITDADAASITGLKNIVKMLGCLPIPTERRGYRGFLEAIERRIGEKGVVTIFPEAHIWPYCTTIRPFPATSFSYPVSLNAPVVAMCATYRKGKGLFALCRRPGMTLYVSEPMYPDPALKGKAAREELRDRVFNWMDSTAKAAHSYEYIRYVKAEAPDGAAHEQQD